MSIASKTKHGPLQGIRIVDLTAVIMGPYAMQVMADFGAEVIKIESPEGDIMRHVGKNGDRAMGPIHLTLNRGKRHVALDLKKPEARDVLAKIIGSADAFVHAMRPKAIERLGLDYASVKKIKGDIVYCGAYGYTADGPYGDEPAYDDLIQELCGIADIASQLAGEPRFFPTVIADKVCGLTLAYALLAALLHKQRTGEGQQIEVPMFETMVQFLMVEHLGDCTFGRNEEIGYARVLSQLRKPHRTTDGYVCALPYNDKNWRDFFRIVDRADLAADPRFSSQSARSKNYEVLYSLLGEILATQPTGYWLEKLRPASIPVAPVLGLKALLDDPHLNAVNLFQTVRHPSEGQITAIRSPIAFSATPAGMGKPAGVIGADTLDVLQGFGYSSSDIDALVAKGAVMVE
ncbi:CaiB/BaiF CoA transferase family protein [Afipia sp. DC4300-2b1]|uniref:CaiB/BaiF CoA transferase family protein n=1 Tax=Afipia sp. DC4300-2b1 TaxID=2804672 RepID=UPI003CF721A0